MKRIKKLIMLPRGIFEKLEEIASEKGISLNALITLILSEFANQ